MFPGAFECLSGYMEEVLHLVISLLVHFFVCTRDGLIPFRLGATSGENVNENEHVLAEVLTLGWERHVVFIISDPALRRRFRDGNRTDLSLLQ